MKEIVGTSNRVLEVDLTKKSFEVYTVSETERKMYLGGKGLGLKLLYDRLSPGVDPLGPDNILAFMPGVLMGTVAPCSGRFAAVTKSPLTGLVGTASCGGPFGMQLKTAGWDGLLVRGSSDTPVYLSIAVFLTSYME
jgi:aldehyde:ferredoxin oxidoreductase